MLETSARLLRLLALLQTARDWTGTELAERLGVSGRTVRTDVERLRSLGYPVLATRGAVGGYRLGAGAALPPLLLDDEEAVAVTIGHECERVGRVWALGDRGPQQGLGRLHVDGIGDRAEEVELEPAGRVVFEELLDERGSLVDVEGARDDDPDATAQVGDRVDRVEGKVAAVLDDGEGRIDELRVGLHVDGPRRR